MKNPRLQFAVLLAVTATSASLVATAPPAAADVTAVTGSAYGYFASVSLFGGPPNVRGPEPVVALPPDASGSPVTAHRDTGLVQIGPAILFSTGPIDVSTAGSLGPAGSVTSSSSITSINTSQSEVFTASSASSTCTATESGATASTTITNGTLRTSEGNPDVDGDETIVPIATNPAPNTTVSGTIESTGDSFQYTFNEQIVNADGSLTVYAGHHRLLGPTAVGDLFWGKSECGVSANDARATPTISTKASPGGPVGTAVKDVATLAGGANPTGTVTFELFSDPACTTRVFTSTNTVTNGVATSANFTPTAPDTYFWTARYSGDANNNGATSPCGAPNESVTITKAAPTLTTKASPGGSLGITVHDVATLSNGFSPTGTVTFRLFSDSSCATRVFTSTNTVASAKATSAGYKPTVPDTYFWTAQYSGDANNKPAFSPCGAPNESVTVTKAAPTLTTKASPGGPLGTSVNDVATLSNGFSPTGTITFRLFSDSSCATRVFTSTVSVSTAKATSADYKPTAPDTYFWTAQYSGDANNKPAFSPCGAPNESVTITRAVPTLTTKASPGGPVGTLVHDVATLSGGVAPTGTVTFRLYSDPSCTTRVFVSTVNVANAQATSGSFKPTAPDTYFWTAQYSGDANNTPVISACGAPNESVTITAA